MEQQNFKTLLNSRGLKATNNRLKLLEVIQDFSSAMPHTEIQKEMAPINRVTLYRILDVLVTQGIIHQAYIENGEIYYALCGHQCEKNKHRHNHIHFKCSVCNAVTCEDLKNEIKLSLPKYQIHKVSIEVEGICRICAA